MTCHTCSIHTGLWLTFPGLMAPCFLCGNAAFRRRRKAQHDIIPTCSLAEECVFAAVWQHCRLALRAKLQLIGDNFLSPTLFLSVFSSAPNLPLGYDKIQGVSDTGLLACMPLSCLLCYMHPHRRGRISAGGPGGRPCRTCWPSRATQGYLSASTPVPSLRSTLCG